MPIIPGETGDINSNNVTGTPSQNRITVSDTGTNDPLAALNGTSQLLTSFQNMTYPGNIMSDPGINGRPHAVRFFINKAVLQGQTEASTPIGPSIQGQGTLSGGKVGLPAAAAIVGADVGSTIGFAAGGLRGAVLGGIGGAVVAGGLTSAIVNNTSLLNITPPQVRVPSTITLYMPDTVNMSYSLGYQEDNMSDYSIPYYGSLGENLLNKLKNGGDIDMNNFSSNASGWSQLFALFRSKAKGMLPVDALLKGQGVAINPQVQLLFKAVGLRQFQFEFMFSPKNAEESTMVRDIIQTFKYYAAPVVGGTTDGGRSTGLFFGVPATFNIQYLNGETLNEYGSGGFLNKIGECVLENVNVDYAPNGYSTFTDGAPTQIRLTLQFKETDIVDRNKVAKGY